MSLIYFVQHFTIYVIPLPILVLYCPWSEVHSGLALRGLPFEVSGGAGWGDWCVQGIPAKTLRRSSYWMVYKVTDGWIVTYQFIWASHFMVHLDRGITTRESLGACQTGYCPLILLKGWRNSYLCIGVSVGPRYSHISGVEVSERVHSWSQWAGGGIGPDMWAFGPIRNKNIFYFR